MCQTLTYLNLAGNSLRDDVNNLYNFLAQPNALKTLDLSSTECAIDAVSCPVKFSTQDLWYFGCSFIVSKLRNLFEIQQFSANMNELSSIRSKLPIPE